MHVVWAADADAPRHASEERRRLTVLRLPRDTTHFRFNV